MSDASFPRWAGPFVGVGVGLLIGHRISGPPGQGLSYEHSLLLGSAIGLVAGLVIWLFDRPKAEPTEAGPTDDRDPWGVPLPAPVPGSPIGRLLAVLSVLLFLVPAVGLCVGIVAALLNRRTTAWPRALSLVGLALAVLMTLIIVVNIEVHPRR